MSTTDINALHGAALRRAFDEACVARKLDPVWHYSKAMEVLFGSTAEDLAKEKGPNWFYLLTEACQGIHDVTLRAVIRAFESTDIALKGDIAALAGHQAMARREAEEQVRALSSRHKPGGGEAAP